MGRKSWEGQLGINQLGITRDDGWKTKRLPRFLLPVFAHFFYAFKNHKLGLLKEIISSNFHYLETLYFPQHEFFIVCHKFPPTELSSFSSIYLLFCWSNFYLRLPFCSGNLCKGVCVVGTGERALSDLEFGGHRFGTCYSLHNASLGKLLCGGSRGVQIPTILYFTYLKCHPPPIIMSLCKKAGCLGYGYNVNTLEIDPYSLFRVSHQRRFIKGCLRKEFRSKSFTSIMANGLLLLCKMFTYFLT